MAVRDGGAEVPYSQLPGTFSVSVLTSGLEDAVAAWEEELVPGHPTLSMHATHACSAHPASREEQEKLNVWVALLNLENMYGSQESLTKVFERAVQYNEPLKVFLHLADIYTKSEKFKVG